MAQPYPRRSTRGAIVALVAAGFQLSMQPVEKMSITAQLAKSGCSFGSSKSVSFIVRTSRFETFAEIV